MNKIIDTVGNLNNFPEKGQVEPLLKHKKSEYRYLIVWSYKVIYRTGSNKVVVSRIFHTSRKPSRIFNK